MLVSTFQGRPSCKELLELRHISSYREKIQLDSLLAWFGIQNKFTRRVLDRRLLII